MFVYQFVSFGGLWCVVGILSSLHSISVCLSIAKDAGWWSENISLDCDSEHQCILQTTPLLSPPAPAIVLPFIWLANSSTSIFVMCSPGTTTSPRYRLVISMVTEACDEEGFGGGGRRYSKVWARTMLRSCHFGLVIVLFEGRGDIYRIGAFE